MNGLLEKISYYLTLLDFLNTVDFNPKHGTISTCFIFSPFHFHLFTFRHCKTCRADGPRHVAKIGLHDGRCFAAWPPLVQCHILRQGFKKRVVGQCNSSRQHNQFGRKNIDDWAQRHGQFLHRTKPNQRSPRVVLAVSLHEFPSCIKLVFAAPLHRIIERLLAAIRF